MEDWGSMQVDLSGVLSVAAAVLSTGVGAWLALARAALQNREREIDRRLDECRSESRALDQRLHTEEKATIKQDGEIARLRDTHDNLADDVAEIKKTMVTKQEWHLGLNDLQRQLSQLASGPRFASSGQSRAYAGPIPRADEPEPPSPHGGGKSR